MKPNFRWLIVILCVVCLLLVACGPAASSEADAPKSVTIERFENAKEPTSETLTAEAAQRLDIQTAPVRNVIMEGITRAVIPYSAVLYDNQGNTWTYTNPAPLTYVRHQVDVDKIQGEDAILSSEDLGEGIQVVIRGAEELFGAEFEFQEE